ncbi:RpnC/YadD family protein [Bacillus wiedmannii]|uniref:hypothetical protein n=1 Tax=Bacillus wiedmannii TaxID=1890302 RepID=UPI0021CF5E65|nr:hypothetical protein [Bacillus wiedmannii]MCU5096131.1 hypothetical protein [Bacillus wiedmannii]
MVINLEHDKKLQRNHDNLFKNLVTKYFEEYIEFAHKELYNELDFSDGYTLLSESVSEIQMFKGDGYDHTVDTAILIKTKSGEKIIIHIEYQSYKQKKFPKRMRKYHLLVADKYDCEVISHAICFLKDQSALPNELKTHTSTSSKSILHFIYDKIELYSYNINNYMNTNNPFILACMGLMKGINTNPEEKFPFANLKFQSYLNLKKLNLDDEQNNLIASFFEVYIPLNTEEQKYFMAQIAKMENETEEWIMNTAKNNVWSKTMYDEGKKDSIRNIFQYHIKKYKNNPKQLAENTKVEEISQMLQADVELVKSIKLEFNEFQPKHHQ